MHILRIDLRPRIQQHLDRSLIAKRRRPVQRSLTLRPSVTHKSARLRPLKRFGVRISPCSKKYLQNSVVNNTVCLAKRSM